MEENKEVLVVEDDQDVRGFIHDALVGAGYRVSTADDVRMARTLFKSQHPDLAILDLSLPDGSGLDICRDIRGHKTLFATPIIMLTAKSGVENEAAGVEAGADQYLNKPISAREIILWVKALLRRMDFAKNGAAELQVGDLIINQESRLVHFKGQPISNLSPREFDLLWTLVKLRPNIVSRKFILSKVWRTVSTDHLVDTVMHYLRSKLPPELADMIQSVPGKGYRFFK